MLVLSALAAGLAAFDAPSYRVAGSELSRYLRESLWDGKDLHSDPKRTLRAEAILTADRIQQKLTTTRERVDTV